MKIVGIHENGQYGTVTVDGEPLDPKFSQSVRNHSPDGFAWGYAGSGPAQLALAILLKAGLHPQAAVALYQRFKAQFIATLPQESFTTEIDVMKWVDENRLTTATPSAD